MGVGMRKVLAALLMATALANSTWAAGGKRVIITFKAGTSAEARAKALSGLKAEAVASILSNDQEKKFVAVVAELKGPQKAPSAMRAMDANGAAAGLASADPSVVNIEEDVKVKWIEQATTLGGTAFLEGASFKALKMAPSPVGVVKASMPTPPSPTRPAIPWGVQRVKAPAAWDTTEGAGVRVAVIDTGIDLSHPALQGKIDGGYNAITDSEAMGSYQDDNGHGTHVSGTIAGNGPKLKGVAPKARLYGVKVLDAEGSGSLSDVIKGIIWCANNDIQVANMSLGSPMPSDAMHQALRYAKAKGVVVVAAAGNSGGAVGYPGAYPETIAVAASDWKDQLASFSSRGPQVKFIAPGVAVVSSMLGGDYANLSGTSMASPHVAGLAALAVSQGYRGLDGPDGVMAQLLKAAKPIGDLTAEQQGAGMIDAGKLVR